MGFYAEKVLPPLMDWAMSGQSFSTYRRQLLADTYGKVLEIGFGTGLNLAYYPEAVTALTVVDPNPGMGALATKRIAETCLPVHQEIRTSEALSMADSSFDCAVSTWTLCSIDDVEQALREVRRVLKPGGKFFFIEHGRSPDVDVQRWQDRLTPVQRVIADGCRLNRPMQQLVEQVFGPTAVEQFYESGVPRFAGYLYRGVATKAEAA